MTKLSLGEYLKSQRTADSIARSARAGADATVAATVNGHQYEVVRMPWRYPGTGLRTPAIRGAYSGLTIDGALLSAVPGGSTRDWVEASDEQRSDFMRDRGDVRRELGFAAQRSRRERETALR